MSEAVNAIRPDRNGPGGFRVFEMHSRKSQGNRTKTSAKFRNARCGVMFSSDVSARGMDYPNITHVIQVGIPSSREQYVHRLGRTARAGKKGQCILLLHEWERYFLNKVGDLPLLDYPGGFPQCPWSDEVVHRGMEAVSVDIRNKCYSAWLGYYNGCLSSKKKKAISWSKARFVMMPCFMFLSL